VFFLQVKPAGTFIRSKAERQGPLSNEEPQRLYDHSCGWSDQKGTSPQEHCENGKSEWKEMNGETFSPPQVNVPWRGMILRNFT
jgi:hypothetical protein